MLTFEFEFPGQQLSVGFANLRSSLLDLRPAWTALAGIFSEDMTKQFQQEGRRPKWAKHTWFTKLINQREVERHGGKPLGKVLEGEGKLEKSMTTMGAAGHIRNILREMLIIGSRLTISTKKGPVNLAALMSSDWEITVTEKMRRFFLGRWGIPLKVGAKLTRKARIVLQISPAAQKLMAARIHQHVMDEAGDAFQGFAHIRRG